MPNNNKTFHLKKTWKLIRAVMSSHSKNKMACHKDQPLATQGQKDGGKVMISSTMTVKMMSLYQRVVTKKLENRDIQDLAEFTDECSPKLLLS